ncbi:MAG: preprotein translocase subunit SecE [bacterium]
MTKKIGQYLKESKSELARVSWPKKPEVLRLTAVVIAVTVAIGAYLGLLDYVFSKMVALVVTGR